MDRNDETSEEVRSGHADFFMGALIGVAAGAAVGLLYAPVRGRDARAMLGERVQDGVARASATIEAGRELGGRGRELAAQGRELVSDARETLVQAVADGRDAYKRVKGQG